MITSIEHYVDRPSGGPRLAYDEARYLAAAGHRVTVLAQANEENALERQQHGRICLLRYRPLNFHPIDPRRAWAHQKAAEEVMHRHVVGEVDIVHGHAPLTHLAACEVFGSRVRTSYTAHSPATMEMEILWQDETVINKLRRWFGLPLVQRMERQCLERSAAVVAVSEFTKQQLIRIHGQNIASKVDVVPGWVDMDRFRIIEDRVSAKRSLGWPLDIPVLFTLRRLVPRMGLDCLVRAVRVVRDRGKAIHVIIGGTGPLLEELQRLTETIGLCDCIQFAGQISNADLPIMYGACDAFVLPTAALECFGLIAIEALACGRPVLATPVAAIPEVLSNFEPRWLARSADENGIADIICDFLTGRLPTHEPAQLRRHTEELYSYDARLAQLAKIVLGDACVPTRRCIAQIDEASEACS